jgi:hypothetical protein
MDEHVKRLLSIPLNQLYLEINPELKASIQTFANGLESVSSDVTIESLTILSILQKVTYVTKTRKPEGVHIYWLSRNQNPSVPNHKYKIKSGFKFEIKTGKQMCTLPTSTHREDSGFHYCAIGRTDKLLVSGELYDIFLELFEGCLLIEEQRG